MAGALLAVFARGGLRVAGIMLLVLSPMVTAVPIGPMMRGRVDRRKRRAH